MNFLRPEAREMLWRWREAILCGGVILWASRLIGRGLDRESVTQIGLGVMIAGLFAFLLYHAILRAKLRQPGRTAGVVVVTEREIGFMGPETGSFVSLDDLTRLEIIVFERQGQAADIYWTLYHYGGDPVMIPLNSEGAEQLFDTFAALRGVRLEDATRAVAQAQSGRFLIWEKPH